MPKSAKEKLPKYILVEEISRRHDEACAKKEDQYIDPQTGYMVFTKDYHLRRGTCCQSGCRHCPWGFKK